MQKTSQHKVLIIGYGYAGKRFLQTLLFLNKNKTNKIFEIALVDCDFTKFNGIKDERRCFDNLDVALSDFLPDIVIVTVNEKDHYEVLEKIAETKAEIILCEKPLVEDMAQASVIYEKLKDKHFSMNLVERFSLIIQKFFEWKEKNDPLETARVEFFWGKNRVKDSRPTIGVISEIIHPLDLVKYIFGYKKIDVTNLIASQSDFSISNDYVIDSFDLIANTEQYTILGHSSFLWAKRHREITGFMKSADELYRINFNFDNPFWDCDQLIIDRILKTGQKHTVLEYKTSNSDFPNELNQVFKVSEFVQQSLLGKKGDRKALLKIVNLHDAFEMQKILESIKNITKLKDMAYDSHLINLTVKGV